MSDTIVDFGGFTVDVSKIREFQDVHVQPQCFVRFDCPAGLGSGFFASGTLGEHLRRIYEAYKAKHSKPDGWYWAKGTGGRRKLIRITDGTIDATWGEPSFRPKVSQSQWSGYEPADPLSDEFMHGMRNQGFHPADWL